MELTTNDILNFFLTNECNKENYRGIYFAFSNVVQYSSILINTLRSLFLMLQKNNTLQSHFVF